MTNGAFLDPLQEKTLTISANPDLKENSSTIKITEWTIAKLEVLDSLILDFRLFSFDDAQRFTADLCKVMKPEQLKLLTMLMPHGAEELARKLHNSLHSSMPCHVLTLYPNEMEIIPHHNRNWVDQLAIERLIQEYIGWGQPMSS